MNRAADGADDVGGRRSPRQIVLRYALLAATIAAVALLFLTLQNASSVVLAAVPAGSDTVSARYGRVLLSKVIAIALGIAAVAVVIASDWNYGRARGFRDLLRRFAGVVAVVGILLSASHAVVWFLAGRDAPTLVLAAVELLIGGALLALSRLRHRS